MMAYGIDFTSAPKKSKPLTVAKCSLDDGVLTVNAVECFTGFEDFEELLVSDGPWIQAAWSCSQKDNNYGIPEDCDPVEGWIADPEMEIETGENE